MTYPPRQRPVNRTPMKKQVLQWIVPFVEVPVSGCVTASWLRQRGGRRRAAGLAAVAMGSLLLAGAGLQAQNMNPAGSVDPTAAGGQAATDAGQYSGQNPGMPQTGTMPNCADPQQALLPQCAAQNGSGFQGLQATPTIPPASMYNDSRSITGANAGRTNGLQNGNSQQRALPRQAPREPLTDFQKFVASTTGQVLPIYGANLFRHVPASFSPLDTVPVPTNFVLGPEDVLRLRVWGQINFQSDLRVDRSGDIYLPQVGSIHVAGLTFAELDGHLRAAIGRVFRNFDLTADVGQIHSIQVYVSGAARQPGVYTVSALSTLVNAIFASGGPALDGSLRRIELRRNGMTVTRFDLYALLVHGDKSGDAPLQNGDVIYMAPAGAMVAMTGAVRAPAIYELLPGETLGSAIQDAGGMSAVASNSRISIERIEDHTTRHAMEVSDDAAGLATAMDNGDVVHVYEIVPAYTKTVILRGNVANPGRFAWHEGMRVSDLIPDKESLITKNYWWQRTRLGLPAPEFEPVPNFGVMLQPPSGNAVTLRRNRAETATTTDLQQNGLANGGAAGAAGLGAAGLGAAGMGAEGMNAQQLAQQQSVLAARQGETDLNGTQDASERGANISVAEAQTLPSGRSLNGVQSTRVRVLAPEIDWNYAVIERMDPQTLKTVLVPFDLGKLVLQHDQSQNLKLEPGDVISIFSEADVRVPIAEQTKLIRLEGEVVHAGTYTALPGETLRHLVMRAGGLTPNAYLYGSEFTRQSTRILQQARIDEYIQQLNMQVQRGNLAVAASGVSTSQDQSSAAAAQGSEQQLIASLARIRATGRIVLEFQPDNRSVASIPNIPLEDGDRFVVPSQPDSVNVVGAVYDQNSFLYAQRRRVRDYLHMAGGPNQDAYRKYAFVIRASGAVVSRTTTNGLWGNTFDTLHVYPGDTIVMPEKTFKPSALRTTLEFTQIISQLAFGALAFSILPIP